LASHPPAVLFRRRHFLPFHPRPSHQGFPRPIRRARPSPLPPHPHTQPHHHYHCGPLSSPRCQLQDFPPSQYQRRWTPRLVLRLHRRRTRPSRPSAISLASLPPPPPAMTPKSLSAPLFICNSATRLPPLPLLGVGSAPAWLLYSLGAPSSLFPLPLSKST
jgi:hypothetical protein